MSLPRPRWTPSRGAVFIVTSREAPPEPLGVDDWDVSLHPPESATIAEIARRKPSLILADAPSGDERVLRFVRRVQTSLGTHAPPTIALVSDGPDEAYERAYAYGAVDVVGVPVAPALLRVKLERHARHGSVPAGRFGPFRIERLLGQGAYGQVFLAEGPDGAPNRLALKVVSLESMHVEPEALARFRREIEALRALRSPHVPRLVGAGRIKDSFYCAMEFVRGESLANVISRGALTGPAVESLVCDIAGALEDVAAAGLVHRDVKPSNVILGPDGKAKLVDFGLAKFGFDPSVTRDDEVLGTAPYIAPELARGGPANAASDAFALGMTALEAALGECPVSGSSYSIVSRRAEGRVPDAAELLAGSGAPLRAAIAGLLDPEASRRLDARSARELLQPSPSGRCR